MTTDRPELVVAGLLARRAVRSGVIWGMVFALVVASSVEQFTAAYSTDEARRQIATTIGTNGALRSLFGVGHALETVPGWTAWRSLGILSIVGPVWALLAATRWLRGEEDSGRWDLVLTGPTTRRGATGAALAALALGLVALWATAAAATVLVGRVPDPDFGITASLFFSAALVAPTAVFMAVGAVASQLAPTRRQAAQLAGAGFGLAFLLQVVGNSDPAWHWALWLSPLGWAQHLHPLTGSSAAPLVPLAALVVLLAAAAMALAGARDLGAGMFPTRGAAPARTGLLGGPARLALRLERPTWLGWAAGLAVMGFFFGMVASAAADTSSDALDDVFARLGARQSGVDAYMGMFYLVLGAALAIAAAGQVAATRDEEAAGRLNTLLVGPLSRARWLTGRLFLSVAALSVLALLAGVGAWAGATSQQADIDLARMVGAAANRLPAAIAVLGLGTLTHGLIPHRASAVAYGLVGWSFVVSLVGAVGPGGGALADLSLFHHAGLLPAGPFRPVAALAVCSVGAAGAALGAAALRRRDLIEA